MFVTSNCDSYHQTPKCVAATSHGRVLLTGVRCIDDMWYYRCHPTTCLTGEGEGGAAVFTEQPNKPTIAEDDDNDGYLSVHTNPSSLRGGTDATYAVIDYQSVKGGGADATYAVIDYQSVKGNKVCSLLDRSILGEVVCKRIAGGPRGQLSTPFKIHSMRHRLSVLSKYYFKKNWTPPPPLPPLFNFKGPILLF